MSPPLLERVFALSARVTTVRREALAGVTNFVTMAYVLFVNPQILSAVADRTGHTPAPAALLTSTALVAALATLAMGVLANLPLALAAGMGLNSLVARS
jgi:AGZA family xanthine/uracil permease-like MFS transporter